MHILVTHAETCNGKSSEAQDEAAAVKASNKVPPKDEEKSSTSKPSESGEASAGFMASSEDQTKREAEATPWWTLQEKSETALKIDNPIFATSEPIPGLHLYHNFITAAEEDQIMAELDGTSNREGFLPWKFARFNGPHKGKRWGVHCNLRDRKVGAAENPLPPFYLNILLPKLQRVPQMRGCLPNEANAIDYSRKGGDYLSDHVDDRQLSKEPIANLSIAGDCYMTFINQKNKGSSEPSRVLLPRRTLQVLTGRARYDYSHGIRNQDILSERRVSVTMRESPSTK
jgi:alkylated DNA repair dioxygenase AlkB